ncbi:MAG TPA: hypothetical protein ENI86_13145, partial [Acidimicrobiales bacterium]|nr:hypothetical protein [Acidimicrobiales bacterium]
MVDGVSHHGGRLLDECGIHHGSVLGPPNPDGEDEARGGREGSERWEALVVTGPDTGRCVGVGTVPTVVGSSPGEGVPTGGGSSRRGCRLVDLGPRGVGLTARGSGVRVEGREVTRAIVGDGTIVELGSTRLLVRGRRRRHIPLVRDGARGSHPGRFAHTPPPSPRQDPPTPPAAPEPRPEPDRPTGGPGPSALLAPLGMGAFMVVVMGNPMFALLAALGPLTLAGNRVEARIRHRRAVRRCREDNRRAAAEHRRAVAAWQRDRRRHAWGVAHLPGDPPVGPRGVEPDLWVRRDGRAPLEGLVVGVGRRAVAGRDGGSGTPVDHMPVSLDLTAGDDMPVSLDLTAVDDMPVSLDLTAGRILGVVGPPEAVGALVRSLVLQAALAAAPSELEIGAGGRPPDG